MRNRCRAEGVDRPFAPPTVATVVLVSTCPRAAPAVATTSARTTQALDLRFVRRRTAAKPPGRGLGARTLSPLPSTAPRQGEQAQARNASRPAPTSVRHRTIDRPAGLRRPALWWLRLTRGGVHGPRICV